MSRTESYKFVKKNMPKEYLYSKSQIVNPKANGGESLMIVVDYFDNGDDEDNIFTNVSFVLQSYSNAASLQLIDISLSQITDAINKLQMPA